MNPSKSRWHRGGLLWGAALGLALGFGAAQPACADKTCSPSDGDDTTPGPAFECAAGEVCYLGQCITTCSAGAELVDKCSSDDDCSGARPNCVRTFCSSCVEGQACVPTLNICRSVSEVELPDPMERPDRPQILPRPLDAGFAPGGVVRPERDAGVAEQPEDREVTRAVFVDLARETDLSAPSPVERGIAEVRSFDTAIGAGVGLKWRADVEPPRVEVAFPDPSEDPTAPPIDQFCELRRLETRTGPLGGPVPADAGDIEMVNTADFPDSIDPELTATFNAQTERYEVMPSTVAADFLTYSVALPSDPRFVFVSGAPLNGVTEAVWPEVGDFGHHVPFRLVPSDATAAELQAGFRVAEPADQDLTFRYDRIETGNDGFEAVYVRVIGQQTELFCEQTEGPNLGGVLRVRAAILDAFRRAEGLTQPATYTLYFERASRKLLQPVAAPDQLVLVTVRIRHSLATRLLFE